MIINIYDPDEKVNIHIQSLINIIQENNWVVPPKKGKGKLPLFRGNGERVNSIYGWRPLAILEEVSASVLPVVRGVLWFQVELFFILNLELYTLAQTLLVQDVFDFLCISRKLHYFRFLI